MQPQPPKDGLWGLLLAPCLCGFCRRFGGILVRVSARSFVGTNWRPPGSATHWIPARNNSCDLLPLFLHGFWRRFWGLLSASLRSQDVYGPPLRPFAHLIPARKSFCDRLPSFLRDFRLRFWRFSDPFLRVSEQPHNHPSAQLAQPHPFIAPSHHNGIERNKNARAALFSHDRGPVVLART